MTKDNSAHSSYVDSFGQRFIRRSQDYGQFCIGIDPHRALVESWGLNYDISGLARFSSLCVEAFRDTACVVKPQVAFYECFGSAGFSILEDTIQALREAGVLVIADAKRGDIGSTMAGYAHAWLDPSSPLSSDAITVSPFLGYGSLSPVIELAQQHNKGVIVLAATSNPEGRELQDISSPSLGDCSISQYLVDHVAQDNAPHQERGFLGNLGVVVGATLEHPPLLENIGGMVLMPGVGAQGGTVKDIIRIAGTAVDCISPNVSRSILSQGPDVSALQEAVRRVNAEFSQEKDAQLS